MNLHEQALTEEFKDDTVYERLVLITLTTTAAEYYGQTEITYDLRSSSPQISAVDTESWRASAVMQTVQQIRPLIFGAAYKILDLLVEFVLKLNSLPSSGNRWTFAQNSTVVFWVARGNPSPCHNHRLLGEQRGEEIFRPLPEFEALVGIQDQPLNECLRLLTTRFPNGFDG